MVSYEQVQVCQGSALEALRNQRHENGKQDGVVENHCDCGERSELDWINQDEENEEN